MTSPDPQDMAADDVLATETVSTSDGHKRKKKGPRYDVYRYAEGTCLGEGIDAPNEREAILKAVADLPVEEQYGQFLVGLEGDVRLKTREKKVIPETIADDWR